MNTARFLPLLVITTGIHLSIKQSGRCVGTSLFVNPNPAHTPKTRNFKTSEGGELRRHAMALAGAVQQAIDGFLDDNDFYGSLDREAHARSREEGEAFLLLTPGPAGRIAARFL